jgi:hypothetical protein
MIPQGSGCLLQSTFLFLLYGLSRSYPEDPIELLGCLVIRTVQWSNMVDETYRNPTMIFLKSR